MKQRWPARRGAHERPGRAGERCGCRVRALTLSEKKVPVLVRTSLSWDSPVTLSRTTDLVMVGLAYARARRLKPGSAPASNGQR